MKLKRLSISLTIASMSPAFAWLGGYDFDERGVNAVTVAILFVFLFGFTYTCPLLIDDRAG